MRECARARPDRGVLLVCCFYTLSFLVRWRGYQAFAQAQAIKALYCAHYFWISKNNDKLLKAR